MKYKILILVISFFLAGCARSVIKYTAKLDESPYQMYGKYPARNFYEKVDISDSLVLKWESETYGSFPNSSVSIYEDLVFVNDLAGRIYCFEFETGKKVGSLKYSSGGIFSTPIPFRNKVVFPVAIEKDNVTDLIYYDYSQGKELEVIELPGRVMTQMIAAGDEVLFTSEVGIAFRFNNSGRKMWETHTRKPTRSSPAIEDDLFIFGNDAGEIIALNALTGDSVYVKKVGGHFFSGVVVSENIIYAGNDDGNIFALKLESGETIWKFDTGARIKMEPSIDDENVYVGNLGGSLFSINKQSGTKNWQTNFRGVLNSTPLITENTILLPDVLFSIHLVDKNTGKKIKSIEIDGRAKLSPVIHKNILFIGFDDGVIRAYEFVK